MGDELSYGSTPLHTQDYIEMQELIRECGDVLGTSNPQTHGVNQPRVQRFGIIGSVEPVVGMTNPIVLISVRKSILN